MCMRQTAPSAGSPENQSRPNLYMKSIRNILIAILLGCILAGVNWLEVHAPRDENVALRLSPTPALIQVSVVGAVVHPGTYTLDEKSRVLDAVEAAGGFVAEADKEGLNLVARLENVQRLDVPYRVDLGPDAEQGVKAVSGDAPPPVVGSQLVDSNTTVPEELDKLPDAGFATATSGTETYSCSNGVVGSGAFVWPSENYFLTGNDYKPDHPGIDIAAGEGSPVYAADSGVVIAQGNDEAGYGKVIQIDHRNGYFTVYAHLSVIGVSMCQSVDAGQWIGAAGSTGNARGAHLHFEVAQDGWYIDPWIVLP